MAVAKGDETRIRPRDPLDFRSVEMSWFDGANWRMHPQWRYCLLNDSDSMMTPEEAFKVYAKQMRSTGKLPKLCEPRKSLVERFLFDMKVTNGLTNMWDVSWKTNKRFVNGTNRNPYSFEDVFKRNSKKYRNAI
ncbi:unnamed protein product [Anisakis simplex]|uniref:Voltage-dependent calcium channel unc-36 (inferred by orthology to a C. elegans protein) n=1 Tax=Anisakis simplex TaxID=6269 RepID=A0A0M3K310_ANISI|nr:unnamed protein product [Anisakis simplex]